MCAKLRNVAASSKLDRLTRSLYYCLFAPHIRSVFLHVHSVRGDFSAFQRNARRVVATLLINIFVITFIFYISYNTWNHFSGSRAINNFVRKVLVNDVVSH